MEFFIVWLVFGGICAAIASSRGRSGAGWFFIGLFLGFLGILLVLVLPNLKEERRRRQHVGREQRRMQEQIHQERIKQETFRRYVGNRIDAHDRVLGVDTRADPRRLAGGPVARPPAMPPLPRGGMPGHEASTTRTEWYYEVAGRPVGPVSHAALRMMLASGQLPPDTLVWCEGMGQWELAMHVPGLEVA